MLIFHWFLKVFGIPCIFALSNKARKSIKKLLFLKLFAIRSHLVPSGWPGSVLAPRPHCHAPPAQPVEPAPQDHSHIEEELSEGDIQGSFAHGI